MFTVPGWNVSAPIATQIEKPKVKDPNKLGKKALKRKEKQEQQVNAENIGELWDKVVDTKDVKSQPKPTAAPTTAPTTIPTATTDGVEAATDVAPEKKGKKRKRGKSAKEKKEAEEAKAENASGATTEDATAEAADKSTTR
jgi:ribosomal RNA-processing protein 8